MAFVTTREMLADARRNGYAVGAFNFENMEMAAAIIAAATELRSPVILQTTPSTVKYAGLRPLAAVASALAQSTSVPVALHLDHGESASLAAEAVAAGYTSVMIDGSKLPLDDNIALTRAVVTASGDIPVEAELGRVGGKEDGLDGGHGGYTDPDDAVKFVASTGVGSLAVAIGTAHGIYSGTPVLDVPRLREINNRLADANLSLPLVLHGASGLSEYAVRECVCAGICKVNFATELRQAYTAAVRATLESDSSLFDPKKYGAAAMLSLRRTVCDRIRICGSAGRG